MASRSSALIADVMQDYSTVIQLCAIHTFVINRNRKSDLKTIEGGEKEINRDRRRKWKNSTVLSVLFPWKYTAQALPYSTSDYEIKHVFNKFVVCRAI